MVTLSEAIRRTQRIAFLEEIYAPLNKFKKKSKEWYELFNSGKVWRDYYCPFEWRAKDYEYQEKNIHYLKVIDSLSTKSSIVKILQNMIVNFSQRSCAIEANTLGLSESQEIWDRLNKNYDLYKLINNEKFPPPSSVSIRIRPKIFSREIVTKKDYKSQL